MGGKDSGVRKSMRMSINDDQAGAEVPDGNDMYIDFDLDDLIS